MRIKQGVFVFSRALTFSWNHGVKLNFDAPGWIEQFGDDNHGGRGTGGGEVFSVDAAYGLPVFDVSQVHAGADDVAECRAGFREGFNGDGEDAAGLAGGVFIFRANGTCARQKNGVPHADSAGEADDGLVGRTAADVLAHGVSGIRCQGSGIRRAWWTEP